MALDITRILDSRFEFSLDGGDPISDNQPNLTTFGDICHFKTLNGANLIASQNVTYADVTVIDTFGGTGSFTFANVQNMWTKLIELNFFTGVGGGGGGGGVTRFDALLDTFTYFGNDGKVPVVNEASLLLEATTFYNFNEFIQMDDVSIETLIDGKIVGVGLVEGVPKLVLTDPIEESDQFVSAVGGFYYADLITQTTPLAYTTGDLQLENDIEGSLTFLTQPPFGITSSWDEDTNTLDFSQLSIGDHVNLRVDLIVTTSAANQSSEIKLLLGEGGAEAKTFLLEDVFTETAAATDFSGEISFQINYETWRTTAAKILFSSDASADIEVVGWNVYIIRKSVNILDITDNTFRTFSVAQLASPTVDTTALTGTVKIGYEGVGNKLTNILFGLEFSKYLVGVNTVLGTKAVFVQIYNKTKKLFYSAVVTSFTEPSTGYYNAVLEEVIDLADVAVNDELEINFDVSAINASNTLTTKGDLLGYDTALNRLPVGADGQVLTADSVETLGVKWAAVAGAGDMLKSVYDPANIIEQLVGLTTTQTLTNKTLTSPVINTGVSGSAVLDDDTFATASATTLATSESIKAYVDSVAGSELPIADTTAIVKGSVDGTKLVRFEVDGLTTGTTRVITMPDKDVVLGTIKSDVTGEPSGSDVIDNIVSLTQAEYDAGSPVAGTTYIITDPKEDIYYPVNFSDQTTVIVTGTAKITFRMPFAMTLTSVRAGLKTADNALFTVDINEAGTSILSTKLTIDSGEKTSLTAATAAVISDSALADDAEMTIDVDTAGTAAVGGSIVLIGKQA
jgi:hypothetical protein